ncbi:MAG: hypothetical protein EOO92_04560 [Pedobacter sp.]|nr:MAG: hypothetical protein EOO92_04560 [Pedobacter sp.]
MKRWFFIALAVGLFGLSSKAQTVKTGVLVVGNGNNAIGAGVQSAKSGANTTILMTEAGFEPTTSNQNISSLIEREFQKALAGSSGKTNNNANDLLKVWTDSIKNLTIIKAVNWSKFKRSGGGWAVELTNGKTIKAQVLIDADRSGKLKSALQLQYQPPVWQPLDYGNTIYRTSVAAGYALNGNNASIFSMYQLLLPTQDNLVLTNPDQQSIAAGQAAGATAAFAAFFHTKTSKASIKAIQGELVNFKLAIMPFADVSDLDSNWKAIQFAGLSGILKGFKRNGSINFMPEQKVAAEDIKQVFKDHFYKAQIWFDDHTSKELTIGEALDLICYTGSKSFATTKAEAKKNWEKVYGFKSAFDESRIINRREFAVLLYSYNNPFNVNADKNGRIAR